MPALELVTRVAVSKDRPAVLDIVLADPRRAVPAVDIQQPGRVLGAGFHAVLAINPDLGAIHVGADVRLAIINPGLGLFADDLFFEIAGVRIVIFPDLRRGGQRPGGAGMDRRRERGGHAHGGHGKTGKIHPGRVHDTRDSFHSVDRPTYATATSGSAWIDCAGLCISCA